jgi:hypothetical protein
LSGDGLSLFADVFFRAVTFAPFRVATDATKMPHFLIEDTALPLFLVGVFALGVFFAGLTEIGRERNADVDIVGGGISNQRATPPRRAVFEAGLGADFPLRRVQAITGRAVIVFLTGTAEAGLRIARWIFSNIFREHLAVQEIWHADVLVDSIVRRNLVFRVDPTAQGYIFFRKGGYVAGTMNGEQGEASEPEDRMARVSMMSVHGPILRK